MTSPIPPQTYTPVTGTMPTTTGATKSSGGNSLGQDAFLKLLVAQLRYQDPTNPADGTAFLAQTAQFTQVEKLGQIAADQENLLHGQLMLNASSLIGRTVSYPGPDGQPITGVVTAASFTGGAPTLRIGDTDVPLFAVTEIRRTA
ncbi:flagellar basal-body rod modification protein FlgD [Micromonospora pattaloongensis]|uniref:Flagellar basal-body rod modification protein FlgD n=1 Tax=Micromonospora pattaloongensis TaxID=405436 RepID=A0A1H3MXE6_9ACTN|nr:flagellar hook capping FlgD N-terminal domain-containing protein [Micromonospora pattaloongensis]SDY81266.1 flagellar basal-body rod modification protein FlgD [Micromonospora pattaloongensis]